MVAAGQVSTMVLVGPSPLRVLVHEQGGSTSSRDWVDVLARQYIDLCDKYLPANLVTYISIVILMIGNVSLVLVNNER